eukprot:876936-Pyramimonas_sp.AAC.1
MELAAETCEVQHEPRLPGTSCRCRCRGDSGAKSSSHKSRHPEMQRIPRHRNPWEANDLSMDTLQTAATDHCSHSPFYTEDQSRHAREVAAMLKRKRDIRGQCADESGDLALH